MVESGKAGDLVASSHQDIDPAMAIEGLRALGAARFDPVRFRFIEALARRAAVHGGVARRVLDRRLAKVLADFADRFDRASDAANNTLARATERFPQAAEVLQQCADASDFGRLLQHLARLEAQGGSGPLTELLAHIARHAPDGPTGGAAHTAGGGVELRSMRQFRSTWSRLSVDRQLSRALAQAPENAGPLNSHFLVLQALTGMRDISPQYLEQFMSYVDALLWLDQADSGRSSTQKNGARDERDKKRKSGRGNAG